MRIYRSVLAVLAIPLLILAFGGVAQAGPLQPLQTFTGGVAFSADGIGGTNPDGSPILGGNLRVETTVAGSTVVKAWLYNVTFDPGSALTTQAHLGGNLVTLNLLSGTDPTCCNLQTYRADVTGIVAPLIGTGPGITSIPGSLVSTNPKSDGLALVVVYSSPNLPSKQSVAILDGGQGGPAVQNTFFALSGPLDKTVVGFNAILSLGIQFSFQGSVIGHGCGSGQFSRVDVNGGRLTTCAGNRDDGTPLGNGGNGTLITIGGVGDDTLNPPDPTGPGGNDDELYGISNYLNQGDLQVQLTTSNPSNDDSIFIAILELTADIVNVCDHPPCESVPAPSALFLLGSGLLGVLGAGWFLRR